MFGDAFTGKTVWLSGSTGFKGAWLCEWLLELGARVIGYALPCEAGPALFRLLDLERRVEQTYGDIRDLRSLQASIVAAEPDFVFHLAAQSLVRRSYRSPVQTYETNVMGTVNVLEALRRVNKPCASVFVTTDKCYENQEWLYGYREVDALGGYDPYSSSKAASELAISSWRRSFSDGLLTRIASARAGNVIGGGDWAEDRIVPDCIRCLQADEPISIRNAGAVRPWQHVLEPLSGYLWLAAQLSLAEAPNPSLASAFNFGPDPGANRSVGELVEEILLHWPGAWVQEHVPAAFHEAGLLQLSTAKARSVLGWQPVWSFGESVLHTVSWYRRTLGGVPSAAVGAITREQLADYMGNAQEQAISWAAQTCRRDD